MSLPLTCCTVEVYRTQMGQTDKRTSIFRRKQRVFVIACGALAASISVGIVIPSTWFVYLYKQTVSITVVVLSTVIKTGTTAQTE